MESVPRTSTDDRSYLPIKLAIDGLEVDSDWPFLRAYLQSQSRFNQLCADIVSSPKGVYIELRLPSPKIVTFHWKDYEVTATGSFGEIHIVCHKTKGVG